MLRRVVSWANDRGRIDAYHFRDGTAEVYRADRADVIWTEAEVRAIEAAAPPQVARALRAALETGLRPGDLVRLSRTHVFATPAGRRIQIRTARRRRLASIPVTPGMSDILDTADGMLVLPDRDGRP